MGRGPALLEGEQLTVVLRRAWYTLLGPAVVLLLCAAFGAYGAGRIPDGGSQNPLRWIVAGTAGAIALRWACWPGLVWYSRSLRLTSTRLILCDGVFSRRGTEIPLGRITGVASECRGPRRLLGAGRLTVGFAGGYAADLYPVPNAPGRGAVSLDDVPGAAVLHRHLEALVAATPRIAFLPPEPPGGPRRPGESERLSAS